MIAPLQVCKLVIGGIIVEMQDKRLLLWIWKKCLSDQPGHVHRVLSVLLPKGNLLALIVGASLRICFSETTNARAWFAV